MPFLPLRMTGRLGTFSDSYAFRAFNGKTLAACRWQVDRLHGREGKTFEKSHYNVIV